MNFRRPSLLVILLALLLAGGGSRALAQQTLEELIKKSLEQEAELEQIPGAEVPEEEPIVGRVRLPPAEEVERLRIIQDRQVDPDTYLVGPGDVLQLYIWGEFDRSYPLQVDPEGNVLIPTVDLLHVAGQSLTAVKEQIFKAAQKKYPGVKISITLSSMRFFTVYLTGAVLREGSHVVQPTTRVSDLIERAGGYLDELRGATIEEEVEGKTVRRVRQIQNRPASRRAIQLIHSDGQVERVDLDLFHATGRVELNPYLRMGDVVHVGFRQHEIFIYGATNQEGVEEYQPGDTIADLVTLANGLRSDAPLERAEVWRFKENSEEVQVLVLGDNTDPEKRFTYADIQDFPLQPKDMVFLRARSNWQDMPRIWISGEVKYQGRYRITPGVTRLRDIIEEAGGLTEEASLASARVIRVRQRAIADPEYERLRRLQQVTGLADMSPEDRAYLKTKWREVRGRLSIDFERLFLQNDESQNIVLEEGDIIYIPAKRRTVTVSGQVKKPGLIDYEPGQSVAFYLEKAGGYAYNANKGGTRLIRARTGLRERLDKRLIVDVGDEIWVPEKEYKDWWAFTQGTMRTIAETLTLVVLVRSL